MMRRSGTSSTCSRPKTEMVPAAVETSSVIRGHITCMKTVLSTANYRRPRRSRYGPGPVQRLPRTSADGPGTRSESHFCVSELVPDQAVGLEGQRLWAPLSRTLLRDGTPGEHDDVISVASTCPVIGEASGDRRCGRRVQERRSTPIRLARVSDATRQYQRVRNRGSLGATGGRCAVRPDDGRRRPRPGPTNSQSPQCPSKPPSRTTGNRDYQRLPARGMPAAPSQCPGGPTS